MNTDDLAKQGYDLSQLKQYSNRRVWRTLFRGTILLLFLLVLFGLATSYLARLPRERFARNFNYFERVTHGAKRAFNAAFLTISADQDDGAQSKLPMAELWVRGERMDALNEQLPTSGRNSQKAKLRYADEIFKVRARYRGDSMNHWVFPQKSWRVELGKTDDIDDMRAINLNLPRTETQISNWLGYQLASRLGGMLTPESEMVHFRLNRKFDGIRLLLEQPDQAFLRRRRLPPGKIFVGDITSEQIYGAVPRQRLYDKASAWSVRSPTEDVDRSELASLLRAISNQDPYRLYYKLNKLADVEGFLKYMALLELVGSVHIDNTHNGKLYFNPVSGKFSPIVWDTVAYYWKNKKKLDLTPNKLFRALLTVPEFRAKKDAYLWEMVNGAFSTDSLKRIVTNQANAMRKDVYAFALKFHASNHGVRHVSNPEWEASIKGLQGIIEERNKDIIDYLSDSRAEFDIEIQEGARRARIAISNLGNESLLLDSIKINSTSDKVSLKRIGTKSLLKSSGREGLVVEGKAKGGKIEFDINDTLFSARKFEGGGKVSVRPGVYIYEIVTTQGRIESIETPSLSGVLSQSKVAPGENKGLLAMNQVGSGWWQPSKLVQIKDKILSGNVTLDDNLHLDDYSRLVIKPGTTIRIAPRKSILVRQGGLQALGTKSAPIIIESSSTDYPWGVFAVQGGPVEMSNVTVRGGSEGEVQHVWYETSLSLHNSKLQINNINLEEAELSIKDSSGKVDGLNYVGVQRVGYRAERSHIQIANVNKKGRTALHRHSDYSGSVYGTAARSEREFKLSLAGNVVESLSLDEISMQMNNALHEAVGDSSRWSASTKLKTNYYHDSASKDFLFRDIYFDTTDRLNYQHSVSYRYRNRYKGRKDYESHLKRPHWPEFWPHRLEFQGKVNRIELPGGFSTVDESRFEFRTASKPFSEENLPPTAPWEEDIFVPYFVDGLYKGIPTMPAKAVLDFLKSKGADTETLEIEPTSVLVTDRFRQHLNIKTEWGSGPNPDQAYIISLDRSEVYSPQSYLDYLRRKRLGYKKLAKPQVLGVIVEFEIEFERNVSDLLDQQIKESEATGDSERHQYLLKVRDAFLSDQQVIKSVLGEHFAKLDVQVVAAQKSKYLQAMDIMNR